MEGMSEHKNDNDNIMRDNEDDNIVTDFQLSGDDSMIAVGEDLEIEENGGERDGGEMVSSPPRPLIPARTLKEELLERERQKRIETERARWKRQFALSRGDVVGLDDDDRHHNDNGDADNPPILIGDSNTEEQRHHHHHSQQQQQQTSASMRLQAQNHTQNETILQQLPEPTDGSVVGTVGEGSLYKQQVDDEDEEEQQHHVLEQTRSRDQRQQQTEEHQQQLGYTMERFLKEQQHSGHAAAIAAINHIPNTMESDAAAAAAAAPTNNNNNVVMERFLAQPPIEQLQKPKPPTENVLMERFLAEQLIVPPPPPPPPETTLVTTEDIAEIPSQPPTAASAAVAEQPNPSVVMERFLAEQPVVPPPLPPPETAEAAMVMQPEPEAEPAGVIIMQRQQQQLLPTTAPEQTQPPPENSVLMERFLSEPVVPIPPPLPGHDPDDAIIMDEMAEPIIHQSTSQQVTFMDSDHVAVEPQDTGGISGDDDELILMGSSFDSRPVPSVHPYGDEDDDRVSSILSAAPDSPAVVQSLTQQQQQQHNHHHHQQQSGFRRLTEQEIQELAAIEEASNIGNAPPSEREDITSEVGDMLMMMPVTTGGAAAGIGGGSVQTHTTASASASLTTIAGAGAVTLGGISSSSTNDDHHDSATNGNNGRLLARETAVMIHGRRAHHHETDVDDAEDDDDRHHQQLDGMETASVCSSHLILSLADEGSVISVTANPPSVTASNPHHDDDDDGVDVDVDVDVDIGVESSDQSVALPEEVLASPSTVTAQRVDVDQIHPVPMVVPAPGGAPLSPTPQHQRPQQDLVLLDAEANAHIVNRQRRAVPPSVLSPASPMKRALSSPGKMMHNIDDFDYDKFDVSLNAADSFLQITPRAAHNEPWMNNHNSNSSRGEDPWLSASSINAPPLHDRKFFDTVYPSNYGTTAASPGATREASANMAPSPLFVRNHRGAYGEEEEDNRNGIHVTVKDPLLPKDFKEQSGSSTWIESIFTSIQDDCATMQCQHEAEVYQSSSILARCFPNRFLALILTLLVEMPVLFMISGGSDRLCGLIGRKRFQLLLGLVPLSSAISGNCGLQSSTQTLRAICQQHVTAHNFGQWCLQEVGAAVCLGFGVGVLLGGYAFFASERDLLFGLTVFVAQFLSIVAGGFTGAVAPLMVALIIQQRQQRRGSVCVCSAQLATTLQDIVASFTMVVLSYRILLLLGGSPGLDPSDACGAES